MPKPTATTLRAAMDRVRKQHAGHSGLPGILLALADGPFKLKRFGTIKQLHAPTTKGGTITFAITADQRPQIYLTNPDGNCLWTGPALTATQETEAA